MSNNDQGWRQWALNNATRMEASTVTPPTATGFVPGTGGSISFHGDRSADDPAALLDGMALVKMTALKQRALDLFGTIPSHEDVQQVRLTKMGHANRIAELTKPRGEGGFGLDPSSAPQVLDERKKMERADQELARQTELKETRTVKWTVRSQLAQSCGDWVLRGVPGGCLLEPVPDQPLSELLTKADGGRIDAAVERYRHRLRELAADLHRVRSSPWPSSVAKAAAKALIDRLADAGAPNLDSAIEHGQPISFASTMLTALVHNVDARGAVAQTEIPDAIGLLCWVLRDQMLAKINAGLDEIADDKAALSQAQREEAEAQIKDTMLAVEHHEAACIWAADAKGEILDFRAGTSPECVLGVRLRIIQPRAVAPGTSPEHARDIIGGR